MNNFTKMFVEAKGTPVPFEGKELIRIDRIPVGKKFSGMLKILSTNSKREQAVVLESDKGIVINAKKEKTWRIWEHAPKEGVLFEGQAKNGQLLVWNAWERSDDGGVDAWLNGAAMIREIDGNTRRYYCNDFDPDAQFDDIIFEITIDENEYVKR